MNKILLRVIGAAIMATALPVCCHAQTTAAENLDLFNSQVAEQLSMVHHLFNSSKPKEGLLSHERKIAFYTLDAIYHNSSITPANYTLINNFMSKRLMQVIANLNKPLPADVSARVYKIYNCGVIVRTKDVTVAFDLVRGTGLGGLDISTSLGQGKRALGYIDKDLMQQLINKCDIMFISHRHSDHFDPWVVTYFNASRKPVICTDDIANVYATSEFVTGARENEPWNQTFTAANGISLKTFIIPGHQSLQYDASGNYLGQLHNNVYVITLPDGTVVAHTGDQNPDGHETEENAGGISDREIFSRSYLEGKMPHINILLSIIWTKWPNLKEFTDVFDPDILIPMHWAELGHEAPTRYTLGEWLLSDQITRPYYMYTWGEWVDYKKQ